MRNLPHYMHFAGATVALAILAGCSSEASTANNTVPQMGISSVSSSQSSLRQVDVLRSMSVLPDAMRGLIRGNAPSLPGAVIKGTVSAFVSDANNNAVYALNAKGTIIGKLTGFSEPQGLAIDKAKNLYVVDSSNSRVQVYAPPYTGKPTSLSDPGYYPSGVAVDQSGNVAVINKESTTFTSGNVTFYAKGATSSSHTIGGYFSTFLFGAFDAQGNLYIDGQYENNKVGEILGGFNGTGITGLSPTNDIQYPGGLQVTTQGHIAIVDQIGLAIYSYGPPPDFGTPIATTSLTGAMDPDGFAFTSTNKLALVADAGLDVADVYAYPAGGSPAQSYKLPSGGLAVGAVEIPAEIP